MREDVCARDSGSASWQRLHGLGHGRCARNTSTIHISDDSIRYYCIRVKRIIFFAFAELRLSQGNTTGAAFWSDLAQRITDESIGALYVSQTRNATTHPGVVSQMRPCLVSLSSAVIVCSHPSHLWFLRSLCLDEHASVPVSVELAQLTPLQAPMPITPSLTALAQAPQWQ